MFLHRMFQMDAKEMEEELMRNVRVAGFIFHFSYVNILFMLISSLSTIAQLRSHH